MIVASQRVKKDLCKSVHLSVRILFFKQSFRILPPIYRGSCPRAAWIKRGTSAVNKFRLTTFLPSSRCYAETGRHLTPLRLLPDRGRILATRGQDFHSRFGCGHAALCLSWLKIFRLQDSYLCPSVGRYLWLRFCLVITARA